MHGGSRLLLVPNSEPQSSYTQQFRQDDQLCRALELSAAKHIVKTELMVDTPRCTITPSAGASTPAHPHAATTEAMPPPASRSSLHRAGLDSHLHPSRRLLLNDDLLWLEHLSTSISSWP